MKNAITGREIPQIPLEEQLVVCVEVRDGNGKRLFSSSCHVEDLQRASITSSARVAAEHLGTFL